MPAGMRGQVAEAELAAFCQEKAADFDSARLIRFFKRKNDLTSLYYCVYEEDAELIARQYYESKAALKEVSLSKGDTVRCVTLSEALFRTIVKDLLLARGYCVETWELEGSIWRRKLRGSPGNVADFHLILSDQGRDNVPSALSAYGTVASLMAVEKETSLRLSLVAAHTVEQTLGFMEFEDQEDFGFLRSALNQFNVKECVLCSEHQPNLYQRLKELMDSSGIVSVSRKRKDFSPQGAGDPLDMLLFGRTFHAVQDEALLSDTKLAVEKLRGSRLLSSAVSALLSYLDLLDNPSAQGSYELIELSLQGYMRYDQAASTSLNIFPGPKRGAGRDISLFSLLNRCKTPMGSRRLLKWMKLPLTSLASILERQRVVAFFVESPLLRDYIRDQFLRSLVDVDRLRWKIRKGMGSLRDVIQLYVALIRIPDLTVAFGQAVSATSVDIAGGEDGTSPIVRLLEKTEQISKELQGFYAMVQEAVDLESYTKDRLCLIKPTFYHPLALLHTKRLSLKERIEKEKEEVTTLLGLESDRIRLENHQTYGYHLRLTKKDEALLRKKRNTLIVLSIQKAGTLFTTATLRDLSHAYRSTVEEYTQLQHKLTQKCLQVVQTYAKALQEAASIVADLDTFSSLAQVAAVQGYCCPQLSSSVKKKERRIELQLARHPCIEGQDGVHFIPNSVSCSTDDSRIAIITGPNMGGKSTILRTVGLLAVMAQIGSFVPCTVAELPIFDCLFTRFGAQDYQFKGISTFMAEMLDIAAILKNASPSSLVLIDEFGRGTSSHDGFGLAFAITESIYKDLGCFCFIATHFHELTTMESTHPGIKNFHMAAETGASTFTLLYQLAPGPTDKSFGIHVAELSGYPHEVVELARMIEKNLQE